MDCYKQYPYSNGPLLDDLLTTIDNLIHDHGITAVDLLVMSKKGNNIGATALSQKTGRSTEECSRYLNFFANITPISQVLKPVEDSNQDAVISTGIMTLDELLGGGLPLGTITEIFGASGVGKSQLLLQIALETQMLAKDGIPGRCVCISTESSIETRRLESMVSQKYSSRFPDSKLMDNISYIYCQDFENQDHIMYTQLPAKLQDDLEKGNNVKSVIIDSIGHHFRGEDAFINNLTYLKSYLSQQEDELMEAEGYKQLKSGFDGVSLKFFRGNTSFQSNKSRKYYLLNLYKHLADLAKTYGIAIIVANQVSDQFEDKSKNDDEVLASELLDPLNFSYQVGSFSGWDTRTMLSRAPEGFEEAIHQATEELQAVLTSVNHKKRKLDDSLAMHEESAQQLIGRLYHTMACNRKRKVPTLGHTWTKLVTSRILLSKAYFPIFDMDKLNDHMSNSKSDRDSYNDLVEGFAMGQPYVESKSTSNSETSLAGLVTEWKARHYATVVASSALTNFASSKSTIEFELASSGLAALV